MAVLITVGITLLVVALLAGGFFWTAYHTMHFNLPGMFIGAVIFLVGVGIASIVLGWAIPFFTAAAMLM